MITKEVLTKVNNDGTVTVTLKIDRNVDLQVVRKVLMRHSIPANNLNIDSMLVHISGELAKDTNLHFTEDLAVSVLKDNKELPPYITWSDYFDELDVTVDIKVTDTISLIPSCAMQKTKDITIHLSGEGVSDTLYTNYTAIANRYEVGAFSNLDQATHYLFQYACDYLENRVNDGKKYAPPC